jgi:hypothetical protein
MPKLLRHVMNMKDKLSKEIRDYMASLGRKGGAVKGVKGFNKERARIAALARWNKVKANKAKKQ